MVASDGLDDLRNALRDKRLVPVVGAGVSIAAANLPGWSGLIRHGIDFAEASGGYDEQDLSKAKANLTGGRLLDAAQGLKALLRAPGGQYAAWLENVFRLSLDDVASKEVLNRIADLLCPIVATTNYDDLLEQTSLDRYNSITWREPQAMLQALKNGQSVFHLHGIYNDPLSIVLGDDNYDELVRDPAYRDLLKVLWIDRTLLFIGCSFDGLQDPDFSQMLDWFSRTFPGAAHRHFALMLEGSFSTEQQAAWLHDLRIQVVPYGPTHQELSDKLRALNVNADRAYAKRIFLSKLLLDGHDAESSPRFMALVEGASVGGPDPKLREVAKALFEGGRDELSRQRQNLAAMQSLARSMVAPESVLADMKKWRRYETKFEGRFRETVGKAAGALFLFDDSLLYAMKRRGVDIHQNVLDGSCRDMLESLERRDSQIVSSLPRTPSWYAYNVENMMRILSTLHAILEANPEEVFIDPEVGIASQQSLNGSLLVLRWGSLELRKCSEPTTPFARLPSEMRVLGGSFERLSERDVVIAFTDENVIAWDPSISMPVGKFTVKTAYGINGVDHRNQQGTLESIVATTDGIVYRLKDLQEVDAWRPMPKGFISSIVMLPDNRVFALSNAESFPLIELEGRGCRDRLTTPQLADQLARLPILGNHWATRLKAEAEWEEARWSSDPPQKDTSYRLEMRFQHPELGRMKIDGRMLLTLHVHLSFHNTEDAVVLLLDPSEEPLQIVGHFLVRDQIMTDFDMQSRDADEVSLVGALLSDFERGYDLAIWARAARTRQGIIFVQEGSTLRTEDDLIHVTFAECDMCFAADDSGGLFRFSLSDKSWHEIERNRESRISGLRFLK